MIGRPTKEEEETVTTLRVWFICIFSWTLPGFSFFPLTNDILIMLPHALTLVSFHPAPQLLLLPIAEIVTGHRLPTDMVDPVCWTIIDKPIRVHPPSFPDGVS